jgi:hypothetical protein
MAVSTINDKLSSHAAPSLARGPNWFAGKVLKDDAMRCCEIARKSDPMVRRLPIKSKSAP